MAHSKVFPMKILILLSTFLVTRVTPPHHIYIQRNEYCKFIFMSMTQHPPCQWMLKNFFTKHNWQDTQQKSWVITPWWFSVSHWRICITCVWPSGSQKLPSPSSRSECHLHFASIRLCLALLFIILYLG